MTRTQIQDYYGYDYIGGSFRRYKPGEELELILLEPLVEVEIIHVTFEGRFKAEDEELQLFSIIDEDDKRRYFHTIKIGYKYIIPGPFPISIARPDYMAFTEYNKSLSKEKYEKAKLRKAQT